MDELERDEAEVEQRFCLKCGAELKKEASFCSSCGTRIDEIGVEKATEIKFPHRLAIILGYVSGCLPILGYVFSVDELNFTVWLTLGCAVYLRNQQHPRAKYHGKIILIIGIVMWIFWVFTWIQGGCQGDISCF